MTLGAKIPVLRRNGIVSENESPRYIYIRGAWPPLWARPSARSRIILYVLRCDNSKYNRRYIYNTESLTKSLMTSLPRPKLRTVFHRAPAYVERGMYISPKMRRRLPRICRPRRNQAQRAQKPLGSPEGEIANGYMSKHAAGRRRNGNNRPTLLRLAQRSSCLNIRIFMIRRMYNGFHSRRRPPAR